MFKIITNWVTWSSPNVQEEWITWEEWQKSQVLSHYEKSELFIYYISCRPNFRAPKHSCVEGSDNRYYVYCFGDFAIFLVNHLGGCKIMDYISSLLDLYDVCKGMSRRLTGDPTGIMILREVMAKNNLEPLQNHDFSIYNYNYGKIHAHTVVQYSLSTLIMKFIGNYMSHLSAHDKYPQIQISVCQQAYKNKIFGEPHKTITPIVSSKAPSINIQAKTIHTFDKNEEPRCSSWPREPCILLRCKSCNRVTDNVWGNFTSCLDCHVKRICSMCGAQAVIIGTDELPKCYLHQRIEQL